jgi:Na+-transporting NADH:ubiquinone oxidoreductase subunit F
LRSDISIEIPEELLSIREYRGVIRSSDYVTRDIKRIGIHIDEPKDGLDFKSGQYLMFKVGEGETRGYSIASTERRQDEVQIEVKLIPNGLGSSYLHSLAEGDELTFFGPYGQFYLRDTSHKVICVAGGVGLAPMKPIIFETLLKYPDRDVELYYGVRTFEDLYDHDMFLRLQANHPRFHYFPTLEKLEETVASTYAFTQGFVNKTLAANLTDGDKSEAYLCGPPLMINSSIKELVEKGVPEIRILYDKF